MELTEEQVFESLGLENTQEAENPADAETAPTGAEETNLPAEEPGQNPSEPMTETPVGGEPESEPEADRQPAVETAPPPWVAEARRRAAQQAAIEAARQQAMAEARQKAEEEMRQFFSSAGLRNPYNDTAITTMDEYRAYQEQHQAEQLRRELAEGTLTPERLNEVVQDALNRRLQGSLNQPEPETKQPSGQTAGKREPETRNTPDNTETPNTGLSQQEQIQIEAEVTEISRMDPNVKEPADLLKQPWSQDFYQFVQEGYSFLGAYHKAVSNIQAKQADAAARQKATNVNSKAHLTASAAPQGGGMEAVPPDEMKYFRLFMPNASQEEIQRYYNKKR